MLSRIANSHAVCWATWFVMRLVVVSLFVTTLVAAVLSVRFTWHRHQHHTTTVFCVPVHARVSANTASIVDIASNVTNVLPLITLAPGEHVVAVDDQPVDNDLVAGTLIERYRRGQFSYVDITTNTRRILVLQH